MRLADVERHITKHVVDQFEDPVAQRELHELGPTGVDWPARARRTIETLLPRLPQLAIDLRNAVPRRLNSAVQIKRLLGEAPAELTDLVRASSGVSTWYAEVAAAADEAVHVVGNLESQQVSAEVQRFIASGDGIGDLVTPNGGSIYPDLVMRDHDYGLLPFQSRRNPIDGPCLQGTTSRRPSNVPDGCEVKTNRGPRIRVDAHGAHPGLHLGVTWDLTNEGTEVNGVWVGYVRIADHREAGRHVNVTTVKYSFGHDLFVTLLP